MVLIVKETKTVEREFTIGEQCMYSIMLDCSYADGIRKAANHALEAVGFNGITCRNEYDGYSHLVAKFKTVIEREATHTEMVSYHLLQALGDVECCTATSEECDECPLKGLIHDYSKTRQECRANIKDLEFFEKED